MASTMAIGFGCRPSPDASPTTIPGLSTATSRNLVLLNLAGGNDALSFLAPYKDPAYRSRRPTLALPADVVLQIGTDAHGTDLGLHPALRELKSIYESGNASIVLRTGYQNASRSHFLGSDIMSTADPENPYGNGWLGRYLNGLSAPVDPLLSWNTQFQLPRALRSPSVRVPSILDPGSYIYRDPWGEADAAMKIASLEESGDPRLSFLNEVTRSALSTIDRVASAATYQSSVPYPASPLGQTLKMVASAISNNVGSKIFWVQTDGYDTHSSQGTGSGRYSGLLTVLDAALGAFYTDLKNQGLADDTLIMQFSEFGRRIDENGSRGTDHGAAGLMTLIGGSQRGGLYGSAARSLAAESENPDLENDGRDVESTIDFRSVYARVIDDWLQADSTLVLQGDYRDPATAFL